MPRPMTHDEMRADVLAASQPSDDSLATTFRPIPCEDCRLMDFPAIVCASRRHTRQEVHA